MNQFTLRLGALNRSQNFEAEYLYFCTKVLIAYCMETRRTTLDSGSRCLVVHAHYDLWRDETAYMCNLIHSRILSFFSLSDECYLRVYKPSKSSLYSLYYNKYTFNLCYSTSSSRLEV